MNKNLKLALTAVIFIMFVLVFTLTKLPERKLTSFMSGELQQALDSAGIYIIPGPMSFSILRGFNLHYDKPEIELPDLTHVTLDSLDISPSFQMLFKGMLGGKIQVKQGAGSAVLHAGMRGNKFSVSGDVDQMELSKIGVFQYLNNLQGRALAAGTLHLSGDMSDPSTISGAVQLDLSGITVNEQNVMGFALPEMKMNEGKLRLNIDGGKIQFEDMHLGKPGSNDDVKLQLTGNITLKKYINSSLLGLHLVLGLSDKVKSKFSFLESLFPAAKTADGRYSFRFTGPLSAPLPTPDGVTLK